MAQRVGTTKAAPDEAAAPDQGAIPEDEAARRVTDYLAGMTDRFCIRVFEELTVPVAFAP